MSLTNTYSHDQPLNYARPLLYTTSLDNNVTITASCFFDLEDSTAEKVRGPIRPLNLSLMITSLYIYLS